MTSDPEKNLAGKALLGALVVVLLIAALPLLPFDDDLYYISPVVTFDPSHLLPKADHWRPLDYLFRVILGVQPSLYPLLNHIVVVAGHAANIALLYVMLHRKLGLSTLATTVACAFFALSPAVVVAVFSIDSLNQTWSMFFGLLACTLIIDKRSFARMLGTFVCCWIAVFWKESGIVFFVVAPLCAWACDRFGTWGNGDRPRRDKRDLKTYLAPLAIGVAMCVVYFGLRFMLMGSVQLGTQGRYSLSLSPATIARNFAVMVGANVTAIDSIAVFLQPRNWALVLGTLALSCPLLAWIIVTSWKALKDPRRRNCLIALGVLAFIAISPYLVMGGAGEMHAYQFTPFFATGIALLLEWSEASPRTFVVIAFASFLAATLVSDAHKWLGMKQMGESTIPVYEQITSEYEDGEVPHNVTAFAIESGDEPLYSVFAQTVSDASEAGQVCAGYWDWRHPETFNLIAVQHDATPEQLMVDYPDAFEASDSVWIVTHDGITTVLKQGRDY